MCTPSWGSAFNYLLACFRGESHARGVRNSGVIGGEGHGCHAVLFSVCCRRHLFVLASVLFCERNAFGTTHFFRCDPVLRLGPRIFFQCDPVCCVCVCVCICERRKGGFVTRVCSVHRPPLFLILLICASVNDRHDRSVPHLRDPWRAHAGRQLRQLSTTLNNFFLPT